MNITEKSLIENAQQHVGPGEQVIAAGVFQPRKASGALEGGAIAGFAAGAIPGVGGIAEQAAEVAGVAGGYAARHGLAAHEGIPTYTLMAVTAQHLYAFRAASDDLLGYKVKEPFAVWNRDRIGISVHARLGVRLFDVEDLENGHTYHFETPRMSTLHGTIVLKLLLHDEAAHTRGAPN